MSDEPNPIEKTDGWQLPEPVYRTSEGHTPKAPPAEEVDTETPDDEFAKTLPAPVLSDEAAAAITEEMPAYQRAPEPPQKPKSGCFRSAILIVGVIALFALSIVIALIYFLFYFRPADTVTF